MLSVEIDQANHIAILEPHGALSEDDFVAAARTIDSMIETTGQLNGILIHSKSFPGWESVAALSSHLKFIREHHKKLSRIALVTDSIAAHLAEIFATHFVRAEIRIFSFNQFDDAANWLTGRAGT